MNYNNHRSGPMGPSVDRFFLLVDKGKFKNIFPFSNCKVSHLISTLTKGLTDLLT